MLRGTRIAVVVPAYHEARLAGRTLRAMPAYVDLVVVVDDASTDGTADAARAVADPRVEVVRHPVNRGVGAAIATGYRVALERGCDLVAVMAGDAQMHPDDLEPLVAGLEASGADYAKGDRLAWPDVSSRMPRLRLAGNRVLSALTRLATGTPVRDSQCGYTVITANAIRALPLGRLWPRYGYPNDLLGMLGDAGLLAVDVPVRPVYADERSGIGFRHALFVIPYVLLRVVARRVVTRTTALLLPTEATGPR